MAAVEQKFDSAVREMINRQTDMRNVDETYMDTYTKPGGYTSEDIDKSYYILKGVDPTIIGVSKFFFKKVFTTTSPSTLAEEIFSNIPEAGVIDKKKEEKLKTVIISKRFFANVDVMNNNSTKSKLTPLQTAAKNGQLECVKILAAQPGVHLYDKKPHCDEADALLPCTPALHLAVQNGHLEVVKFLCGDLFSGKGMPDKFNSDTVTGLNILHEAVTNNRLEIVKYILEDLQPPDVPFKHIRNGVKYETIPYVDVRSNNENRTALFIASIKGYVEIVEYLCSKNPNVNILCGLTVKREAQARSNQRHWDISFKILEWAAAGSVCAYDYKGDNRGIIADKITWAILNTPSNIEILETRIKKFLGKTTLSDDDLLQLENNINKSNIDENTKSSLMTAKHKLDMLNAVRDKKATLEDAMNHLKQMRERTEGNKNGGKKRSRSIKKKRTQKRKNKQSRKR